MYTANTMACAIEALGLSLPNSSAQEAISAEKKNDSLRAGRALNNLIKNDLTPRKILTREAFENAITIVIALGGSTNAVLHLLAIANEAKVRLSLDDFTRIGKRVPVLADVRPSGNYLMSELISIGGITPLMKLLLQEKLLHGDVITVTGKTLSENLQEEKEYPRNQDVIRSFNNPIKKDSHLRILYGYLAPEGSVAKISGKEGTVFKGKARPFNSEEQAMKAILGNDIHEGDVIIIRYEGPKGGPGTVSYTHLRAHET